MENPMTILAHRGHDTAFFHEKRWQFVKSTVQQRAAARGMKGLISSSIELFPHQLAVIRRVLEDPIQRYLLADEVGLGKTVEVGVIIRQFLLEEPQGQVIILVPPFLVKQWKR